MNMQELLDKEAELANAGHSKSVLRIILHEEIKSRRGEFAPYCHGNDDCSTETLMKCPWRIDCGPEY